METELFSHQVRLNVSLVGDTFSPTSDFRGGSVLSDLLQQRFCYVEMFDMSEASKCVDNTRYARSIPF